MEKNILNRIILIGNGFDRSLNLPTSYSHFLDWIINQTLSNLLENIPQGRVSNMTEFEVKDKLFTITTNISSADAINSLKLNTTGYKKLLNETIRLSSQWQFKFVLTPKYKFIDELFESYDKNSWVDVEELYFIELLKINETNEVKDLNNCLDILKSKLTEYLRGLKSKAINYDTFNHYRNHFFGPVLEYNSNYKLYEVSKKLPTSFYFVNFNYTPFLIKLLDFGPSEILDKSITNHIHGDFYDYPIIFGYGNETGEDYLRLEKLGDDFLENIKSTHYFNSTHYRDLETQLNEPYEVYVYGLSCGMSDNILLKTIMGKSNCKQIRIFYKNSDNGKDNFRNILMNISRTLKDKDDMRSKIISKQPNDNIPQLKQIN